VAGTKVLALIATLLREWSAMNCLFFGADGDPVPP
jgi:hypothetical protein